MLIENQIQKGINNQTLLIVASAANAWSYRYYY
jgi:hypothetical protein